MKVVEISEIKSNILEYTKRTKKIRAVEFIFTIEEKKFKKVAFLLDKKVFSVRLPFSECQIRINNFNKITIAKQIEAINKICKEYVNNKIEIGSYDENYIDIKIEKALKANILVEKNIKLPCFIYTSSGPILSYNKVNEFSEFITKLIKYYELKGSSSFN